MAATGRSAVVVVVDRLGAGFLGPYGNTWLDTPHSNRLASRSLVYETALADSPDLPTVYRSYWTGGHAMAPPPPADSGLAEFARSAGLPAILLTDEPAVAEHPLAAGFAERALVPPLPAERAAEVDETALGRVFAQAIDRLTRQSEPAILWLHSRGMAGPWDAPLQMRSRFADAEDPEPLDLIDPPEQMLATDFDPDALLGLVQAYSGQVALFDACLGLLLDALDEHPLASETLVALTSPRGYPLGEHRRVGPCDQALYGELLHVPLLVRVPDSAHDRVQRLVQPGDLFTMLADWLSPTTGVGKSSVELGQVACTIGPGQRAIRTPAWFLRESLTTSEPKRELYAKPDDRWEANEVSSRCTEAVELLAAQLDSFQAAARENNLASFPLLAELLIDVWR